jgi:hypothetical protein
MFKLKSFLFPGIAFLCCVSFFVLVGCSKESSTNAANAPTQSHPGSNGQMPSNQASPTAAGTKFTSAYTDLKTQCKAAAKAGEGHDTPLRCDGYGGYEVRIDFSAASSHFRVQPAGDRSDEAIELAAQPVGYDVKRKIEWRLADGKPFAIIFRVDKSKGTEPTEMWWPANKTGEALMVKGLKGYERINTEVNAKDPNANEKAREVADNAYTKGR